MNQADLTKETERRNLPGATSEYPNWRRKMRLRADELRSLPAARTIFSDQRRVFRSSTFVPDASEYSVAITPVRRKFR